jgi:hypothetical protein
MVGLIVPKYLSAAKMNFVVIPENLRYLGKCCEMRKEFTDYCIAETLEH